MTMGKTVRGGPRSRTGLKSIRPIAPYCGPWWSYWSNMRSI